MSRPGGGDCLSVFVGIVATAKPHLQYTPFAPMVTSTSARDLLVDARHLPSHYSDRTTLTGSALDARRAGQNPTSAKVTINSRCDGVELKRRPVVRLSQI